MLYFLFERFLEARAEICKKIPWFFGVFEDKKKKSFEILLTFRKPSVSKSDKYLPLEITAEDVQKEANVIENKPLSSFFSSAWTKVEGFTKSTTTNFAKEGKKVII